MSQKKISRKGAKPQREHLGEAMTEAPQVHFRRSFVSLMVEHFEPHFLGVLASWRENFLSHQG
jgi:hypothetical protein